LLSRDKPWTPADTNCSKMAEQQQQVSQEPVSAADSKARKPSLKKQKSAVSYVFDPEEKTLFGRTAASWAKILIFYFIYYSFLALLIWLSVTTWSNNLPQPGSGASGHEIVLPRINTRVDQPGSSVYPMVDIPDYVDGENVLELSTNVAFTKEQALDEEFDWENEVASEDHGTFWYVRSMLQMAGKYDSNDFPCETKTSSFDSPCKVANAEQLTFDNLVSWTKTKKPVVALALNNKLDWRPKNAKLRSTFDGDDLTFVKDAVFIKCYQTKPDGSIVEDSKFEIKPVSGSEAYLGPNFFPYHGRDKSETLAMRWNKPFVLMQFSNDEAWDSVDEEGNHIGKFDFSCYYDGDNVDSPAKVHQYEKVPALKGFSEEMMKMNIGYVKFTLAYPKKGEE